MEKIISGRHADVSRGTREYILQELDKIEDEYHKLTSARVVLDKQKLWFNTEVILHGKNIAIEAKASELKLNVSITNAMGRADKQLRKHLDKLKDRHRHPRNN